MFVETCSVVAGFSDPVASDKSEVSHAEAIQFVPQNYHAIYVSS